MGSEVDELYLTWLINKVGSVNQRRVPKRHTYLLRQLHDKEFVWLVPNDDNRAKEGICLREDFLEEYALADEEMMSIRGCSMLEMLVALSGRVAYLQGGGLPAWFWHFIDVMDLYQYNDKRYDDRAEAVIDETLDRVIWRKYDDLGHGGLFPLNSSPFDQRKVELWQQANAFLIELD